VPIYRRLTGVFGVVLERADDVFGEGPATQKRVRTTKYANYE